MGLLLDARFIAVGILFVLLSTLFATQYATTKVGFQYAIVHPSNADIRFVGSDNSSADGLRVLRVSGANGTNAQIGLEFGNWSANMNNTYTAAFAIVNEEPFAVNITHISVTNTSGTSDYMQVWLHGNGSLLAENDPTSVFMYNNGSALKTSSSVSWQFAKGDGDVSTMYPDISDGATMISTGWDESVHVRYTQNLSGANDDAFPVGTSGRTLNNASDFVWVQISINVPAGAVGGGHTGAVEVHFESGTHLQSAASGDDPVEDTYIYAGGGSIYIVRQYLKSDLSYIGGTASYGSNIYTLAMDDTYIYAAGSTTQTVRQYLKSDLSYIGQTASYGGTIRALAVDDTHVYAGGQTTQTVRQYLKSDLSYIGETANYDGTIYALAVDT